MGPAGAILLVATSLLGQQPGLALHQDFTKPLHEALKRIGPDAAEVIERDTGMRIKLSATRKHRESVGVALRESLKGDFEFTAAYELLAVSRPTKDWGSGVVILVAPNAKKVHFAKVGRYMRVAEGSCIYSEYWRNQPDKEWKGSPYQTEAASGKLRLVREGESMRYLSAEDDGEFKEHLRTQYTAEDLAMVQFMVSPSSPGDVVDARLISLTIRPLNAGPAVAAQPGPAKVDTLPPAPTGNETPPIEASGDSGLLWVLLAGAVAIAVAGAGWFLLRRRGSRDSPRVHVAFICPGCEKKLKAKAELAGKRIKCPHCGEAVAVPQGDGDASLLKTNQ